MPRRLSLSLACALALVPLFAGAGDPKTPAAKTEYYKGKVVPLADLVARAGSRLDADAAPYCLVLAGEDGKVYPLVKDSGSRLFFNDPALLNRPMRLTGQILPESQILRVTAVHSYIKGQLHDVYYWCDICSIRRGELQKCDCCGDIMVLREDPLK